MCQEMAVLIDYWKRKKERKEKKKRKEKTFEEKVSFDSLITSWTKDENFSTNDFISEFVQVIFNFSSFDPRSE